MNPQLFRQRHDVLATLQSLDRHSTELNRIPFPSSLFQLQFLSCKVSLIRMSQVKGSVQVANTARSFCRSLACLVELVGGEARHGSQRDAEAITDAAVKPLHDGAWWAQATKGFNFNHPDMINADVFNRILWRGIMGNDKPYPQAGVKLAGREAADTDRD